MSGNGRWTVQSQGTITLDGHPGREVSFAVEAPAAAEKGTGRARIFLVGNRLYQAIMVGPASKVTEEELDHFVKSFELLQKVPRSRVRRPATVAPADPSPGLRHRAPTVAARRLRPQNPPPGPAGRRRPASRASPPRGRRADVTVPAGDSHPVASGRPARGVAPAANRAGDRVVQVGDLGPDPSKPAEVAIQANRTARRLTQRAPGTQGQPERAVPRGRPEPRRAGRRAGRIRRDLRRPEGRDRSSPSSRTDNTYIEGTRFGKDIPPEMTLVARPGYAVGTINTRTGLTVDAFQVVFVRFKDGHFDAKDFYILGLAG